MPVTPIFINAPQHQPLRKGLVTLITGIFSGVCLASSALWLYITPQVVSLITLLTIFLFILGSFVYELDIKIDNLIDKKRYQRYTKKYQAFNVSVESLKFITHDQVTWMGEQGLTSPIYHIVYSSDPNVRVQHATKLSSDDELMWLLRYGYDNQMVWIG